MAYNVTKFFAENAQPDRIQLSDEFWVDIKHEMSLGDHDRFNKTLFQWEGRQQMNRAERRKQKRSGNDTVDKMDDNIAKANFQPSTVLLLEINILDWNLPGPNGRVMPIDHKTIGSLTQEVSDILGDEISDRNPTQALASVSQSED